MDPKTARTEVVILVHGIRDFALWQNSVRSSLEKAGFIVEATNYGRLNLIRFLMPFRWVRAYAIQAVAKQIRMVEHRHPNKHISVIAHSFGTYVIASLLRDEFDTRFHRMIFCGSVVRYDFPFEQCVGRFEPELLNEVGTADVWPAIAESVTAGYGSAGTYGFRRPFVRDRWHNGAAHGFFLTPEFANKFWVPFLASGKVVPGSDLAIEPSAWLKLLSIFKIKYLILLALLVGIVFALLAIVPVSPRPIRPTPTPMIPTPRPTEMANEVLKDVDLGYSENALVSKLGPATYDSGHSDVHNTDNYQLEEDLKRAGTYFQVVDEKKFADADAYFASNYRQASWRIGDSILIARIDRESKKVSALRLETPLYREEESTCLNVAKFGPLRRIVASGKKLCIGSATLNDFADPRGASIKAPYGPGGGWEATCAGEVNPGGATGHGSYLNLTCEKSSYPNSPLAYDITLRHEGSEAVQDEYSTFGDEGQSPTEAEPALTKFVQTYGKRVVNVIEMYSAN